ncbi:hypothetical protein ACFQWC_05080 [Rossellomorea sp. GCM10028870]|uniref:hypothetical protein n=1 Tax=unclassified Rossellomorea TaxID=2837526 RepID=UPI0030E461BA
MYERGTTDRKNLLNMFNSGSGFPNNGTGFNYGSGNGYQGYGPWADYQDQVAGFGGYAPYSGYGPQGYPPPGFPQQGFGPSPYVPGSGYGYGINPIGAGLIGLGLGFLGGQIVNSPFKGPHKRYYYYL